MRDTAPALDPCPLRGERPTWIRTQGADDHVWWGVECEECSLQLRWFATKEQAAHLWNRHPTRDAAPPEEKVTALMELAIDHREHRITTPQMREGVDALVRIWPPTATRDAALRAEGRAQERAAAFEEAAKWLTREAMKRVDKYGSKDEGAFALAIAAPHVAALAAHPSTDTSQGADPYEKAHAEAYLEHPRPAPAAPQGSPLPGGGGVEFDLEYVLGKLEAEGCTTDDEDMSSSGCRWCGADLTRAGGHFDNCAISVVKDIIQERDECAALGREPR